MSLAQLLNVTHAVLIEGLDEDGEKRVDQMMAGKLAPAESQADAFLRARGRQPRRGAPVDFRQEQTRMGQPEGPALPPPMPEGYKLAPVGVQVREPGPTRGLEYLDAALGVAPRASRAKAAVPKGPARGV